MEKERLKVEQGAGCTSVKVTIESGSGRRLSANVRVKELEDRVRRSRAFKALGLGWGVALICLPLPPIHWVMTPGALLAGVWLFFRRLSVRKRIERFDFSCPECGEVVVSPDKDIASGWQMTCAKCFHIYRVRLEY